MSTPKISDLALATGHNPAAAAAGMPEALKFWDTFVGRMPDRLANPTDFRKVLANNQELVYGMMEACGLRLSQDNLELREQVSELELTNDESRDNLVDLAAWVAAHPGPIQASLFMLDDGAGGTGLGDVDEEDDGLPHWKVSFVAANGDKHSIIVDHREMSREFADVSVVKVDPHPEFEPDFEADTEDGESGEIELDGGVEPL